MRCFVAPSLSPCKIFSWMNTIQPDLNFNNLLVNESIDVAQYPLWRLMSTFGAKHSLWCML